jgi:hypothetical protein
MRVSDSERGAVGDLLAKHYADGRLDDNEFKERIDRAMSAKTRSDLSGLTTDLPRLDAEAAPPVRRRRHSLVGTVLLAALVLSAISMFSWGFGAPHVPWLLIAVVGLLLWRRHSGRNFHWHDHHSHPAPPPFV